MPVWAYGKKAAFKSGGPVQQQPQSGAASPALAMAAQMGNQAMLAACLSRRPAAGGEPLSDALREKFERRSGVPLDDVRVHHNSDTPEQLDAEACARGNEVFIGPGNEKDLEHEVGHVVQQKQGLVQATNKVNCVAINDNEALENSALFPQRKTVRRPEGQNPLNARVTQLCKGKKRNRDGEDAVTRKKARSDQRFPTIYSYAVTKPGCKIAINQGPHTLSHISVNTLMKNRRKGYDLMDQIPTPREIETYVKPDGHSNPKRRLRYMADYRQKYSRLRQKRRMLEEPDDAEYRELMEMHPCATYAWKSALSGATARKASQGSLKGKGEEAGKLSLDTGARKSFPLEGQHDVLKEYLVRRLSMAYSDTSDCETMADDLLNGEEIEVK